MRADTFVLMDTHVIGETVREKVEQTFEDGDFRAILHYLSAGDSAIAEAWGDIPSMPDEFKGMKMKINVTIVTIKSPDEINKEIDTKKRQ